MKVEETTKSPAGSRLKKLRKAANLTQDQLATMTGVPQSTISYLELKAWNPTVALVQPLADFFGVTVDYLCRKDRTDEQTA